MVYASQLRTWTSHLVPAAVGAEEPLAEIFLGSAGAFLVVVSAGLGFTLHSSK